MKRSSRLIILVGIILAVAAFAGIVYLGSNSTLPGGTPQATQVTTVKVLQATTDIPLGAVVTADQVTVVTVPVTSAPVDAFSDPSQVVGHIVRTPIAANTTLTSADFANAATANSDAVVRALKQGMRAISLQVDQASGVGTLIQPGDRVDVVIGLKIQEYMPLPATGPQASAPPQPFPGGPQLSVKDIIENVEVVGTLFPPPTTTTTGQQQAQPSQAPSQGVGLTGQQEIVILAVTAQQAEVIKFAQVEATDNADSPISLILRAPADASAPPDKTSGIVLKTLIDQYGVLPPILLTASPQPR